MKIYIRIVFFIGVTLLVIGCQQGAPISSENTDSKPSTRIISLSGFLTEVLHELGHAEHLVGRDVTSTYPKALVDKLPNLGHVTQLNTEAILELKPSHIFVEEKQTKQSEVFDQLKNAGIKLVVVPTSTYFSNSIKATNLIKEHLSTDPKRIESLTTKIDADSLQLTSVFSKYNESPSVLFIYARGAGRLMVGGKNTSAAAIIEKAGGRNAIQSFDDFKALTPEALVEAAPDVILMFESGLASLDGKKGLEQITGIPQTPAYKNDRIISMDGHYLTSFGTRSGQAALELAQKIHNPGPAL